MYVETAPGGQVSVELLVILAIALLMLTAFLVISQQQAASVSKAAVDTQAKNTIADLAGTAKEVYAHGEGSKEQVYITIPSGTDPYNSQISNRSIRLRVSGNDYVDTEAFEVHGSLPTTPGNYWVWVVSEGNKVRIGYAMVSLSRQSLLVTMKPNETRSQNFDVTNVWTHPINLTLAGNWAFNDASFVLSGGSASLPLNGTKTFTATFTTTPKAVGIYLTDVTIRASDSFNSSEAVTLPVILQVVSDPNARPPLTAIPPILKAALNATNSTTRSFQICTNAVTSVTGVSFAPSSGVPGSWVSNTQALGPIGPDSCSEKLLIVTVPAGTGAGNYTGYINVLGQGASNAQDSIALEIDVGSSGDIVGPDVKNIHTAARRTHVWQPVTILATADDNLTGGSRIKSCQIKIDNDPTWNYMFPVDGTFDSPVEDVSYTYFDGFDWGAHNASLKCTDAFNNVGPARNYTFKIAKEILFVVSMGNETDWSNWVLSHFSPTGYAWDYTVTTTSAVENSIVDLTYYDTVIFISWDNADAFTNKVNAYRAAGGYLGLFGDSAHLATRDLNVTWHPDNPHPETSINVINNTHFITQGFGLGLMQVYPVPSKTYEVWADTNSTALGGSGIFYPDKNRLILADDNRVVFWGPEDPWKMNQNGVTISTRVIDYMINQSVVD